MNDTLSEEESEASTETAEKDSKSDAKDSKTETSKVGGGIRRDDKAKVVAGDVEPVTEEIEDAEPEEPPEPPKPTTAELLTK